MKTKNILLILISLLLMSGCACAYQVSTEPPAADFNSTTQNYSVQFTDFSKNTTAW